MVNPIHIVSIALGVAFALGFLGKRDKLSLGLVLSTLAGMVAISAGWFIHFLNSSVEPLQIFTGGFKPPFAINLQMGLAEATFTLLINVAGFLGAIYLTKELLKTGKNMMLIFLVFILGLNVMVMTRDLFNLFVFSEIQSIALAGLIILDPNRKSIPSGFKYVIATGLISSFLLLGTVFAYYFSGTLNIDFISQASLQYVKGGAVAVFMVILAVILELKPFPANGWALDVYESAHPGIGALVSGIAGTTSLFVLYKLIPVAPFISDILITLGLVSFVASNLLGLSQTNPNRLLGYSSIGQLGLLSATIGMQQLLGDKFIFIALTILISHFFAKAGLFWLSGIINRDDIKDWAMLRKKPILLVLFGVFIFSLIGFPPLPSFFGKWSLIMELSAGNQYMLVTSILIGSFIEGIYLFRWLGYAIKLDFSDLPEFKLNISKFLPTLTWGILLIATGVVASAEMEGLSGLSYWPLIFIAFIYLIDELPIYIKNTLSIAGLAFYSWLTLPELYYTDMLRFIFMGIFLIGGILTLIAGYAYKGKRRGFYPVALIMYAGLAYIIQASTTLEFFFGWELMTAGSYFLIIRGKKSINHALSYMLFSIGGAYAILAGFGITFAETQSMLIASLSQLSNMVPLVFILLAIGFMTKTASLGLHIWLPGAHAEAESDVSPMVSAILLKAGVFGLLLLMIAMGNNPQIATIAYYLGWLGALTALVGNMAAAFQEDAKRLLAYSSIAQLGYILFALAMMSHLGWLTAMYYSINHFLYKAILFLTIGAVVLKVGTHSMYKMGGLIKNMPLAFIAVLIGIIALSGVPPLSGFGGKWLFYNAVIDKHWYFQGIIVFFSGIVAFLYLYKLIYSIFLGQLKDNLRHVTDISLWFAIPIYILIIGIMIISAKPEWLLQPLGKMISQWYPNGALAWNGGLATSTYGYWNGNGVMITIGIMFTTILIWLIVLSRKAQKVKQFNIVYAAEAPQRPETTHQSYNMYAGYNKALGWIVAPKITEFWNMMSDWILSLAHFTRLIYNGNGQRYLIYILGYFVIIYFLVF